MKVVNLDALSWDPDLPEPGALGAPSADTAQSAAVAGETPDAAKESLVIRISGFDDGGIGDDCRSIVEVLRQEGVQIKGVWDGLRPRRVVVRGEQRKGKPMIRNEFFRALEVMGDRERVEKIMENLEGLNAAWEMLDKREFSDPGKHPDSIGRKPALFGGTVSSTPPPIPPVEEWDESIERWVMEEWEEPFFAQKKLRSRRKRGSEGDEE